MDETSWLDRSQYPFDSHFFEIDGARMHYVDEGDGPPLLMVHGTPTWSFLYRHLIRGFSSDYRVIAPDHLGFGLSDKPEDGPYLPEDHARRLAALIQHLRLEDLTLVVHDYGGPTGLSYAIDHPENVRGVVLFNTWMWSLKGDAMRELMAGVLGSAFGRFLYTRFNFSPRVLIPAAMGDRSKLTPEIHQHYTEPFPRREDRRAPWLLAHELVGSGGWYEDLWSRRDRIRDIPALILWGMKDPAFREEHLNRWTDLFSNARVVRFPEAGHMVQEEERDALEALIREFLDTAH